MIVVRMIRAISNRLDTLCGALCVVLITAMVLMTGTQIACRLLFTALAWSEEVTRYLLVWSTFIGATCVYKRAGHISVTVARDLCPPRVQTAMQVLVHLLCGAFFCMAAYYGYKYMNLQSRQLSAALRIPMRWMYLVIPLSCGVMSLHVADALLAMLPGARTAREGAR